MNTKQALPWMVLQHLPELGHARQRKLLDQFGSPKAILRTAPSQWAVTVSPVLADAVSQWQTNPQKSAVQQRALRDIDYMQKAGIQLITWASADYPLLLANIFDPTSPALCAWQAQNPWSFAAGGGGQPQDHFSRAASCSTTGS